MGLDGMGCLKEDVVWQLHMVTKSMVSQHRLDKFIEILHRV